MADQEVVKNPHASEFCRDFLRSRPEQRIILGRNAYAQGIADRIEIGAFVDDFTRQEQYLGKPVIRSGDIPPDALVVSSLLGKPFTGEKRLREVGARQLDYFGFYEECGLGLPQVRFWGGFKNAFHRNRERFDWIESSLADDISRSTYSSIVNFRLSGNLEYMRGFTDREKQQYFEPFLDLAADGEVFIDVGGFDGYTTLEFIKRCPKYRAVYFFEPDPDNMQRARERLAGNANIRWFRVGVGARKGFARFASHGSVSSVCSEGNLEIAIERLDSMLSEGATFIKMDIEGGEEAAIEGARTIIETEHPRLAIAVYHEDNDFWRIPELVFSICGDYDIYLRHYTEGVVETVMFFIPST